MNIQPIYQCTLTRVGAFRDQQRFALLYETEIVINKSQQIGKKDKIFPLKEMSTSIEWVWQKNVLTGLKIRNGKIAAEYRGEDLIGLRKLLDGRVAYLNFDQEYKLESVLKRTEKSQVIKPSNQIYVCSNQYGQFVAKVLEFEENYEDLQLAINEITILQKIKMNPHKNLLSIREIFVDNKRIILVMDYCRGNTLYKFLESWKFNLTAWQAKKINKQLLRGVKHLHSLGIMHRDLKLDNIVFRVQGDISTIVIIDYGFSTFINDQPYLIDRCGTPGYIAPEVWSSEPYTERVDIYSLGSVFHMVESGDRLFPGTMDKYALARRNSENRLVISNNVKDPVTRDLLYQMTAPQDERPSASECLDHDYFVKENLDGQMQRMTFPDLKNPFKPKFNSSNL